MSFNNLLTLPERSQLTMMALNFIEEEEEENFYSRSRIIFEGIRHSAASMAKGYLYLNSDMKMKCGKWDIESEYIKGHSINAARNSC